MQIHNNIMQKSLWPNKIIFQIKENNQLPDYCRSKSNLKTNIYIYIGTIQLQKQYNLHTRNLQTKLKIDVHNLSHPALLFFPSLGHKNGEWNFNVWRTEELYELSWDQLSSSQQFLNLLSKGLLFSVALCGSHSPLTMHGQPQGRLLEPDQRDHHRELWQIHRSYFHIPKWPRELWRTGATMGFLVDIPTQMTESSDVKKLLFSTQKNCHQISSSVFRVIMNLYYTCHNLTLSAMLSLLCEINEAKRFAYFTSKSYALIINSLKHKK